MTKFDSSLVFGGNNLKSKMRISVLGKLLLLVDFNYGIDVSKCKLWSNWRSAEYFPLNRL
jgi:hypothetical protein